MKTVLSERTLREIEQELADSKRMRDKIQHDPRRRIDQPCEKLQYWDGKVTGLEFVQQLILKEQRRAK